MAREAHLPSNRRSGNSNRRPILSRRLRARVLGPEDVARIDAWRGSQGGLVQRHTRVFGIDHRHCAHCRTWITSDRRAQTGGVVVTSCDCVSACEDVSRWRCEAHRRIDKCVCVSTRTGDSQVESAMISS